MPKPKAGFVRKLNLLAKEFENECVVIDNGINGNLFCSACGINLGSTRFLVKQHVETKKHLSNRALKSKQLTLPTLVKKDEFSMELFQALVAADISLRKLDNPTFRNFMEKYMQRKLPDQSTLRKNCLESAANEVLDKIRSEIGENSVWISIDETTDAEGRYIANVMVGALVSEKPATPYLLNVEHLQKTNSQTIAKTLNDSLCILWTDGIKHDRVLLLITDAAPYMTKAARDLTILYTKMVHVTCIAHGFHRLADNIRERFPEADTLVNNVNKNFLKAPYRVQLLKEMYPELSLPPEPIITRWATWLRAVKYYAENWTKIKQVIENIKDDSIAISKVKKLFKDEKVVKEIKIINENYIFLADAITKLETRGLPLNKAFTILDNVSTKIKSAPNKSVVEKLNAVIQKNTGLEIMNGLVSSNIEALKKFSQFKDPDPGVLSKYRFAPVVSVDVERSFSVYKNILAPNRRSFTFEHLKQYMLINCFNKFGENIEN